MDEKVTESESINLDQASQTEPHLETMSIGFGPPKKAPTQDINQLGWENRSEWKVFILCITVSSFPHMLTSDPHGAEKFSHREAAVAHSIQGGAKAINFNEENYGDENIASASFGGIWWQSVADLQSNRETFVDWFGSADGKEYADIQHKLKKGDTLEKIAQQSYGDAAFWTCLYIKNSGTIKNFSTLDPKRDKVILFPKAKAEQASPEKWIHHYKKIKELIKGDLQQEIALQITMQRLHPQLHDDVFFAPTTKTKNR